MGFGYKKASWVKRGFLKVKNFGAHHEIMLEPSIISEEYGIVWRRPTLDLKKLKYLKFEKGLTQRQLAIELKCSTSTIRSQLRKMEESHGNI